MSMADEGRNDDEPEMSYSERGKKGGRPRRADREDVLDAIEAAIEASGRPGVARTPEIGDRLPLGPQATRNRLHALVDEGILETDRVGSGRIWWFSEDTDS